MKQTGLWSRLNRKYRAKLRERMGERGAAMMLAILFVMVVLTTSALVMTTLFAQAIPYKNNKENSQANYAAESGLEVGLSYLQETLEKLQGASSLDALLGLLPATSADTSNSAKDGTFTKYEGASVLLNHVALNKVDSVADTASYTPDDLSYRVRINFYKDDPDGASATMITNPSDLKDTQYAEIIGTGFVNRYKDGRASGDARQPQALKRAVCKIGASTDTTTTTHSAVAGGGRMGKGFYAASPYNRLDSQFVWVPVDYTGVNLGSDPSGEVKFSAAVSSDRTDFDGLEKGVATLNPVNRTCMLATTIPVTNEKKTIAENLDLSKTPQAGSGLVLLPAAYNAGGDTYKYTEECRTDGAYSSLNAWVYYKDNSIRLASNMNLCVTGVSVEDADGKAPATLQKCGTSYGVRYQSDYYTDEAAQQAEKSDPDSLLNKYQKWIFYNGFINAGYWNEMTGEVSAEAAKYKSPLPESKGYSVAGVQRDKKTRFQRLEATHYDAGPNDEGDPHFAGGNIKATPYKQAYMVTKWTSNFSDSYFSNGADMEDATASFSQAGEAGYLTNQIVNSSSGFCTVLSADGKSVYTDTCDVRTGDFDAKCYQKSIMGQGFDFVTTHFCPTADKENFNFTSDRADYDEDSSADGSGKTTTIRLYDTNGGVHYLKAEGSAVGLTTDINDATKFTRYNENNKTKSVTIDGKTQYPWAGTFQTASDLCLTEIYPGDYVANDENGKDIKRQYNRKDGHAMLKMLKCGANRDVRGRIIKSQAWNADVDYGHKGGFGSYTWTTETTTVTIPSNTNLSAVVDSNVSKTKW